LKLPEGLFILVCAAIFVAVALAAQGEATLLDREILLLMRNNGAPAGPGWLLVVMRDITALGGHTVLVIVVLAVTSYLLLSRDGATAFFIFAAALTGTITNSILKLLFDRARPDFVTHLTEVATLSFPSGHAALSAVVYLTLGMLLAQTHRSFRFRAYFIAIAITLVVLVGLSRIYLGVHYPTDVIAGWCFGTIWSLGCAIVFRRFQQKRLVKPAENP
jgi:undecaprenyl-diphosphatase